MEPYEFISDYNKVTDKFGMWPSFHDGEVHRVVLDRTQKNESGFYVPSVEVYLRGWILIPDINDVGFYKEIHDSIIHFRFEDVSNLELDGLNHQNVLSSLNLELFTDPETKSNALHIELEHCYGLSGIFSARKAKVLSVVPYVE
jgi:Immunity protein 50